ncbi:MAG: hypothetical protein ACXWMJ_10945 [Syntrophales bacterium]
MYCNLSANQAFTSYHISVVTFFGNRKIANSLLQEYLHIFDQSFTSGHLVAGCPTGRIADYFRASSGSMDLPGNEVIIHAGLLIP